MAGSATIILILVGGTLGLGVLAGAIVLQVWLCKKESPWPGVALPVVWFILAALPTLFVVGGEGAARIITLLLLFGNIPTVVFLVIYFACRGKHRRQARLEKMNIQDL